METEVKERPILFSGPMVRAILAGRKTQTRRIVKCLGGYRRGDQWAGPANPSSGMLVYRDGGAWDDSRDFPPKDPIAMCPFGQPGDRLWVRETTGIVRYVGLVTASLPSQKLVYRADEPKEQPLRWKPAIHMLRSECRLVLELTDVRVERLNKISEADAYAEGIEIPSHKAFVSNGAPELRNEARCQFTELWESINGEGSWDANPWVWVVEFKKVGA